MRAEFQELDKRASDLQKGEPSTMPRGILLPPIPLYNPEPPHYGLLLQCKAEHSCIQMVLRPSGGYFNPCSILVQLTLLALL